MYLVTLIGSLVQVYTFMIFVYVLFSWFPSKTGILGDINNALATFCDPYLNIFRKIVPPIGSVIDISPIIALLTLQIGANLLIAIL